MSGRPRIPSTWDQYERGGSPGAGSLSTNDARSVAFEDDYLGQSPHGEGAEVSDEYSTLMRRRRSSVSNRLAAVADVGGVNSIRSFTRSWQRAAGFTEVIPQRPALVFAPDQEPLGAHDGVQYGRRDEEGLAGHSPAPPKVSLLRQHLEGFPGSAIRDDSPEPGASESRPLLLPENSHSSGGGSFGAQERKGGGAPLDGELRRTFSISSGISNAQSIFAIPPQLAAPDIVGSYGSFRSYGTVISDDSYGRQSMAHAAEAWRQQQAAGNVPDGETQPILVKEVEDRDGKIVLTVEGQSTLPQTIFNSTNVLIGVGLLSLPMGMKYAGWLCGMLILFAAAAVTSYTAKLLAKCMDLDPSLITFSDLAYISFGRNARIATSILFTMELLAACVALIVLFADSMELLFNGVLSITQWKIICSIVLIPLNFLPLRFLSFTSIIGILCCFTIVAIVIIDGFIKPHTPGSLLEPAATYLFPANWLTLPLSFGLLMSPWGGHGVFPNIYRDMRHPHKYGRAVKITFTFTYLLDATAGVAGLLMFGDDVMDAITSNILTTAGYPQALTYLMCGLIAIIPLTKIPLNARPIISTAEVILGVHQQAIADSSAMVGRSAYFRGILKIVIRVMTIFLFLMIAVLFPAFDSIMAFMGSALCFTICVTLPLLFYLKLFSGQIKGFERAYIYALLAVSIILSAVGTVFSFLPRSMLGQE